MRTFKRLAAATIIAAILATGCGSAKPASQTQTQAPAAPQAAQTQKPASTVAPTVEPAPVDVAAAQGKAKYVFLFIGDGMGYPQINTA
ncbi:MAG: hypothetical protein LBC41_10915, partial [Clostridiales bacterium]|nr:hypothetical protein [Clostridiales bacterium]